MARTAPISSSLTQAAHERFRADLPACRLQPGGRLRINELCQTLSASLSAVREALPRLTSEGLVAAEPQRGFHAAPISAEEPRDLTGVRARREHQDLMEATLARDVGRTQALAAQHLELTTRALPEQAWPADTPQAPAGRAVWTPAGAAAVAEPRLARDGVRLPPAPPVMHRLSVKPHGR